ncbi:MAG: hypothetical protein LC808_29445 [Actinobacteria bacterium]|nr:hypothetical protein [Actinomycetota bacterium]
MVLAAVVVTLGAVSVAWLLEPLVCDAETSIGVVVSTPLQAVIEAEISRPLPRVHV